MHPTARVRVRVDVTDIVKDTGQHTAQNSQQTTTSAAAHASGTCTWLKEDATPPAAAVLAGVLGGVRGTNPAGGALGLRAPARSFVRVDLPAPLGPSKAILLRAEMSRVTPCSSAVTECRSVGQHAYASVRQRGCQLRALGALCPGSRCLLRDSGHCLADSLRSCCCCTPHHPLPPPISTCSTVALIPLGKYTTTPLRVQAASAPPPGGGGLSHPTHHTPLTCSTGAAAPG